MKLADFDYDLPRELIAQFPARTRAGSRMLVVDRAAGTLADHHFRDLPDILDRSYFLVLNDSKVLKARLFARRASGGKVEVFLVRRLSGALWSALLRPSGRIKQGERLYFDRNSYVTAVDEPGGIQREIEFPSSDREGQIITRYGQVPLPPYITRPAGVPDRTRYQTVYADHLGSVAAPTAGLHFDRKVLIRLDERGIGIEKLTLHVGPGTFKPVTSDEIERHVVDPEYAVIGQETAAGINARKTSGARLLAVGTTAVRTLEAVADDAGMVRPYEGMASLFIYPPYRFKTVAAMLTNFHLPKTSLLMLVAAFCGREMVLEAYRHAVERRYRFYSYGDCMLIL